MKNTISREEREFYNEIASIASLGIIITGTMLWGYFGTNIWPINIGGIGIVYLLFWFLAPYIAHRYRTYALCRTMS